ncbi:MAG TPA: hypothetical protein VL225_11230 [Vicinamibacterales bacterium]|jgi:hypothetical protein|nr:hypothetical protein [Vicinamibacterales bacterium]
MEIRFVSSLTPEDENAFAPAVLKAVVALLDQLPIAYTLRIETAGTQVYQHTHPSVGDPTLPFRTEFTMKTPVLPAMSGGVAEVARQTKL